MQSTTQTHAKLFIPGHEGGLDARSDEIVLDELEMTTLIVTTCYLSSVLVQKWMRVKKFKARSTKPDERLDATKQLKRLAKAIGGDRRTYKKRRYAYWRIAMLYQDLMDNIKGFRRLRKEGNFDQEYFEMYCDEYEIPNPYPALMLDAEVAPGQLALEILIAQGLVEDVKSFEEFRPIIRKIQKKHFGGDMLSVAQDAFPVISDFLDLPTIHPEVTLAIDPMMVLERVPSQLPRPNFKN